MIIHSHIRDIFEHPKIVKESHVELRNLFHTYTKHLRALKALGEETESWDHLIIYIMCNKFDAVTRRDWESFKITGDLPTMNDINTFLKQKCDILEKLESCKLNKPLSKSQVSKKTRGYGFPAIEKMKCYFCHEEHSVFNCSKCLGLSVAGRISEVKRLKLCSICLRDTHPFWKCKMRKCFKCHKAHNTVSHFDREIPNNQPNVPTAGAQENVIESPENLTAAIARVGTGADRNIIESQCDVARLGGPSQVLLSTAMVLLMGDNGKIIKARALLDGGSQSNFLSERLCDSLG